MRGMIIAILVIVSLILVLLNFWFVSWIATEADFATKLDDLNIKKFEGGYDSKHESSSTR